MGLLHVVEILVQNVDIIAEGGLNDTALQAASDRGQDKVVRTLLDVGADVNAGESYGTTQQAGGHGKILQILLISRADINAEGLNGTTLQAA